jgi:hypothetical protein
MQVTWESEKPNPLTPFPHREGGRDLPPSPTRRGVGGEVFNEREKSGANVRLKSKGTGFDWINPVSIASYLAAIA